MFIFTNNMYSERTRHIIGDISNTFPREHAMVDSEKQMLNFDEEFNKIFNNN